MSLIEKMKISADSMSLGERFLASLQVTVLGVGIVFFALLLLYFVIKLMTKVLQPREGAPKGKESVAVIEDSVESPEEASMDQGELVAVITAAVAASLHTSTHNIIVKNIVRSGSQGTPWANSGLRDQMRG